MRRVRGGCLLYSGFLFFLSLDGVSFRFVFLLRWFHFVSFRFFLSFDVVDRPTDCVSADLKGVMIISGRRSVFSFFLEG